MNEILFYAKKVVATLLYPVGTALVLWFAGIVLWRVRKWRNTGFTLILAGGLWLVAASLPVTGIIALDALEKRAGPYADPEKLAGLGVRYILVLGGDCRAGELTVADRAACSSLVRVMEGIRLWRGVPAAKLVLSGGGANAGRSSTAEAMAAVASDLGVPRDAMILETHSLDTDDEARELEPLLAGKNFALVTSASHMPRSLMVFARYGLKPVPAPADFETRAYRISAASFLPHAFGLMMTQKALHEYYGMLALRLKPIRSNEAPRNHVPAAR